MELAQRFQEHREHLLRVAHRMLGSHEEAEDAVQEAWLRLSAADTSGVTNLGGWLTTVVARICLDMLRARKSRVARETAAETAEIDPRAASDLADSLGVALLVVLEALGPIERVAFVLHDMFDLSFEEIAPVIGRSVVATRQLASRARRRVRGEPAIVDSDRTRHQEIVGAFLAASRDGNIPALISVLAPDVVLRADAASLAAAASNPGAPVLAPEVHGAEAVANAFKGRARAAKAVLIDGDAGAAWMVGGQPRAAFVFAIEGDRVVELELVMEPARIAEMAFA